MNLYQDHWGRRVRLALADMIAGSPPGADIPDIVVERPPTDEMGDLAFPMFPYSRLLRRSPARIAADLAARIGDDEWGGVEPAGPYLNVRYGRAGYLRRLLDRLAAEGERYGCSDLLRGQRISIEFSSPNTNKPLHLGHLRNNVLGESVSRILRAAGADLHKITLINDRGIHICKSMAAYRRFGEGATPSSTGRKSDHFVGDYYVRYEAWRREEPGVEEEARAMLKEWEAGDAETRALWKRMNDWAIAGLKETYAATDISFDRYDYESETYLDGKREVMRGLEQGIFSREEDGAIWVDLSDVGLDRKVLLRSDGTSIYLTQDIGTAIRRFRRLPFDRLIYVVASEQRYHFQVLFQVMRKLGFDWAEHLQHLSYGMVQVPEGRMKSREGTVVDADDLIAGLKRLVLQEMESRERLSVVDDPSKTAHSIALAALHYWLLRVSPGRDMLFDPAQSIALNGDTGPYLQYVGARISSMLRQIGSTAPQQVDVSLLQMPIEWRLTRLIGEWPQRVIAAAERLDPSLIGAFLRELAKSFSRYYHDYPIAVEPDAALRDARLALARSVLQVLRSAFDLAVIPFVDAM